MRVAIPWWAIDALFATDADKSSKLDIVCSPDDPWRALSLGTVDSKIVHDVARLQDGADGLLVTSSKVMAGAQPDELGFIGVQV